MVWVDPQSWQSEILIKLKVGDAPSVNAAMDFMDTFITNITASGHFCFAKCKAWDLIRIKIYDLPS